MIIITIFVFALPVGASSGSSHVYDSIGLLSISESYEAEAILKDASDKAGVPILLVISGGVGGDGGYYGWYLSEFGLDTGSDSVILVVNRDPNSGIYNYYLDTFGDAYDKITDTEVNRILDGSGVYDNLKSGNIIAGLEAFIPLAAKAYSGKLSVSVLKAVLVSLFISAAITGIVVGVIIYKYKRKLKSQIYPLSKYASLSLNVATDNFIGRTVTRTRVNTSSGSRGGSGGGSRGGGRRGGR